MLKVLMLVPYLYMKEIAHGDRNASGLAYMNRAIADEVGKKCDLHVYTQSYFVSSDQRVSTFTLVKKRPLDLFNLNSFPYLHEALKRTCNQKLDFRYMIRSLYYALGGSCAEKIINDIQPDVLFIHSVSNYTIPFLLASLRTGVSTVTSLHGLISLDKDLVSAHKGESDYEMRLLDGCDSNSFQVTMISSGMKERVEEMLNIDCSSVSVIPNFCSSDFEIEGLRAVRKNPDIPDEGAILCIGTLYPLKNQISVIHAYALLDESLRARHPLYIIGDGPDLAYLKDTVDSKGIDNVIFTGRVSHAELIKVYQSACLVVMASLSEGFGLPVLEGYWFGLPAVLFSDVDAFQDLYSANSAVVPISRSVSDLSSAISLALTKKWDRELINEQAKKFSADSIASQYLEVLNLSSGAITNEVVYGS